MVKALYSYRVPGKNLQYLRYHSRTWRSTGEKTGILIFHIYIVEDKVYV